jgi:hypothetical protein
MLTEPLTTEGIIVCGLINAALPPIHRLAPLAGWAKIMRGEVAITPERSETVSADGWGHGGCVRVGNARARPPPYISFRLEQ